MLGNLHITQQIPVNLWPFEPLPPHSPPHAQNPQEQTDQDDRSVVYVCTCNRNFWGHADEDRDDRDKDGGEEIADVAELAEVEWMPGKDGASAEDDQELGDGVGDVLWGLNEDLVRIRRNGRGLE